MKNMYLFLKSILNNSLVLGRQLILAGFSLLFFLPGNVLADGNETLGIPSIAISPGSGIVAGGVGLRDKTAGTISVDVPVGATVQQVLIYWMGEGFIAIDPGDDSIAVEGTGITGVPIGVSISPDATRQETGYRQDITGLGLVVPGPNILQITGLEYSRDNYGAAVLVIYSDTTNATIELLDGLDHAYFAAPGDRMVTVAQTINFSSYATARTANIILLLGDATADRPDEIEVTVGAATQLFTNMAQSSDGAQHDTVTLQINVPAGETSLTVEPFSRDTQGMGSNPDSLVWNLMAFSLADAPRALLGDRVWEDLNANGIQDCTDSNGNGILGDVDPVFPNDPAKSDQGVECGDKVSGGAGIAGVPVNLFQPDENGDCTIDRSTQVITGADGLYLFPDLEPGDYCVQFGQPPANFCDTDDFALGAPQFTALNVGNDPAIDSDADPVDGKTEALTLGAGETNRTLDAGFVCPAKIGDRVWFDDNEDGLQDAGEEGVPDIVVTLFECTDGQAIIDNNKLVRTTTTDVAVDDMNYMFGAEPDFALEPGEYFVQFVKPDGTQFTTPNVNGDDINSDCLPPDGISSCVTLGSRGINLNRDCGLIPPPPPECGIGLDKQCRVEPQPSADIAKCKGKLQQFTVVWDGLSGITIDSVNMGTTSASGTVNKGDEVTFFGPYSSNDVVVNISGPVTGQSTFHVSCSDEDFNGSDDCGKLAGDGKSNDASMVNLWKLEGFIDADGQVLDCHPVIDGEFAQNCTFTPQPQPSCDTVGKPNSLTFKYTGGACPGDNDQGSKANCSGTVYGMEMASIAVNTADGYTVSPTAVDPDGLFTITRGGLDFKSNTDIDLSNTGGTQLNDVHTSCSAPLAVGDEFGAITLVAINGQTGGVDVTYRYVVTNSGDSLKDVTVTDSILGNIAGPFDLASNGSQTFTETALINGTTVNVGTASGNLVDGLVCKDSDSVLVKAVIPPCVVTPGEFKLEDDRIKWKLTNAGDKVATVESIELSAPDEFGAVKKVKLNGDIFKDDTRPMTWTFTDADFINDLKNRQINVGDTKELTFETTQKFKNATADQISITVNFKEGCSVTFVPGAQAFVCRDAKPIDSLSMIWSGTQTVTVSAAGQQVVGVIPGQEVTFSGLSGMGNDVVWNISGTINGVSTFHVSCSDSAMNGPEDCGTAQGDGKSDDKGLNLWLFEGMAGTNGLSLDCSP